NTAVTGELTLSGRILPVGGVREKILAAKRAGIRTVIMPHLNRADIDNLPEEAREGLEIKFAENMEEIINEVLEETAA
ncbi:MAG: ATP-dependent protease La 1, partial [Nitrospirae bacterium]|nr:ATP-dependent protease La 1 [Nitrospirota bacterium]